MRTLSKVALLAFCAGLPLLMAPSGGVPSRLRLQALGVGMSAGAGNEKIRMSASDPYIAFYDASGVTLKGFLQQHSINGLNLSNSVSGGVINLSTTGGGAVQVNGSAVRSGAFERVARAKLNDSTGTCSLSSNSGFTSCTHSSPGVVTINFTAAGFTAAPVCVATVDMTGISSGSTAVRVDTATAGAVNTYQSGTLTNANSFIVCTGQ
jgi:hypothetical protein